jgi:hypothetical protein
MSFYEKYGISRLIVHNEDYVAFFTHKFFIPMIQQIERSALAAQMIKEIGVWASVSFLHFPLNTA